MRMRSVRWSRNTAASLAMAAMMGSVPALAVDGKTAGQDAGQSALSRFGSKNAVNSNISLPMTNSSNLMQTVNGATSFPATLSAPSSAKFLEVFIQPSGTGDLQQVIVSQDLNTDGTIDNVHSVPSLVSGVCANGFISCNAGTWSNCKYYTWAADTAGRVTEAPASITDLGGCYCINSSCGSNLVWVNSAIVLKDLGGGIVNAVHTSNTSFTITNVNTDITTITYSLATSRRIAGPADIQVRVEVASGTGGIRCRQALVTVDERLTGGTNHLRRGHGERSGQHPGTGRRAVGTIAIHEVVAAVANTVALQGRQGITGTGQLSSGQEAQRRLDRNGIRAKAAIIRSDADLPLGAAGTGDAHIATRVGIRSAEKRLRAAGQDLLSCGSGDGVTLVRDDVVGGASRAFGSLFTPPPGTVVTVTARTRWHDWLDTEIIGSIVTAIGADRRTLAHAALGIIGVSIGSIAYRRPGFFAPVFRNDKRSAVGTGSRLDAPVIGRAAGRVGVIGVAHRAIILNQFLAPVGHRVEGAVIVISLLDVTMTVKIHPRPPEISCQKFG